VERRDTELRFAIADREDPSASVPVRYEGAVPDPFREGREVIVTGALRNGTLVAERDSLITKCPSKFSDEAEADPEHVIIE
jgi:cytochrome c-type biogenesis protein CcmE